jgi:glycosyltransferase involved in cell wall biosynthesis
MKREIVQNNKLKKQTKIFVDCHVFDQSLQGTTTYIKGMYLELIKDKTKTFYFASHKYNLEEIFGIQENVNYINYKSKNKFYRLLIELPQIIKNNNIDYAHFQYIVPPIKNCKFIVTIHDVLFLDYPQYFPFFYKLKNKILFRFSAKYSDIVLTVSQFSKNRINKHFQIKDVLITPNAVDELFFEQYDKLEAKEKAKEKFNIDNYFLFISRWEPRKNHHSLLKVFVEANYYLNHNLVFVGDDAIENKEYEQYYETLPEEIKSKIFKFQKVNFNDLLIILRGASLSVYPSIAEGFGIPPLEAIAAEIPSICSNTTAMSDFDFMKDNLFNPLDIMDMNDKIKKALNDKELVHKKQKLQEKYNWENSAKVFKDIISDKY